MAIEVQSSSWCFFKNLHRQGDLKAAIAKRERVAAIRRYFRPHFLHDLESLYWTYIWFIHHRVPVGPIPGKEIVAHGQGKYFSHSVRGHLHREFLILRPYTWSDIWDDLEPLYSSHMGVIGPVRLNVSISREYEKVHQTAPEEHDGTWRLPFDCFTDKLYDQFARAAQIALLDLGSDDIPVERAGS